MDSAELRAWRALRGLTQQQMADLIGMSPRRVQQWEAGDVIPRVVELAIMALTHQIAPRNVKRNNIAALR